MTSSHQTHPLFHLAQSLGLASSDEARLQDLLLEFEQRPDLTANRQAMLEQVGIATGDYLQSLLLTPSQLKQQASRYKLVKEIRESEWLLISQDSRGKIRIEHWQAGQIKPISFSQLQRLTGAEPLLWLALEPHRPVYKPKRKPIQRLLEFLQAETRDLGLVVGYSLGMGVLGLGVPIAIQSLVNTVAFGSLTQPLVVLTALVLLTLGTMSFMRIMRLILVEMMQRRIMVRVTQASSQRLVQIQSSIFEQRRLSELVNRFFDVLTVQKSASFLLLDGLAILLQTLTGMLLLAFYHPFLLAFDVLLLAAILFTVIVLGIGGEKSSIQESGQKYAIAAWLEELASHSRLFKPTSGMQFAAWKTESLLQQYLSARSKHFRVLLRQNISAYSLQTLASASLLGMGGWLVIKGELTIGQLVAAELIVAGVVDGFAKLGKHFEVWYDLMAAMDKLGYLFDLPQEKQQARLLPQTQLGMTVQFEQVNYSHSENIKSLKQLQFEVKPGERVGIYGANTWEAHSLLDLIYGSYLPDNGLILVDQQPLHQLLLPDYRTQVSLARHVDILDGTVLDNLRIASRHLTRQQAQHALEQVGLWERIRALPEVLETRLNFNGFPLSQDETHRLMLARTLVQQPRLVLIDGLLDGIDARMTDPLAQSLLSPTQRPPFSLVVVTSDTELLPAFDRSYSFVNGQLCETKQGMIPTPSRRSEP